MTMLNGTLNIFQAFKKDGDLASAVIYDQKNLVVREKSPVSSVQIGEGG
jgi:hypothetical protein